MLTLFALLFAASADPAEVQPAPARDLASCGTDPSRETWLCRAMAAQADNRFADSASAFETVRTMMADSAPDRANIALAAGNMWIAAGEAEKARAAIDSALASGLLGGRALGEARIDRARADELGGDLAMAAADLRKAEADVADDPFLWYLKASVAVQQHALGDAKAAVARGLALAPDSADLLLLDADIARAGGDLVAAQKKYEAVRKIAPGSVAARSAEQALGANAKETK